MTSRFPSVPITDAKLMTLMYGNVRVGALYSSDVLLPLSDNASSIAFVMILQTRTIYKTKAKPLQRNLYLL